MAAEENLYIVCSDRKEVCRVSDQADKMGLDIHFPLTFTEFLDGRYTGRFIDGFVIDNAEYLISTLAMGAPVKAISITDNEKTPYTI